MRPETTLRLRIVLAAFFILLFGCSSNQPEQVRFEGAIVASSNINPDLVGGFRPVNVKVFFLNSDAAFKKSDFTQLYSSSDATLGNELVFTISKQVLPGQTIELAESIPEGTRYVAAIAAYRALEDAQWRDIEPLPEKCWACRRNRVSVNLDRLNVEVHLED